MREKTAYANRRRYTPWPVLLSRPGASVSEHRIISVATKRRPFHLIRSGDRFQDGRSLYTSQLFATYLLGEGSLSDPVPGATRRRPCGLLYRHALLQLFEPIEDQLDLRRHNGGVGRV